MGFNYNRSIIAGYLTDDPELKTTQNGISVTSFTVAVNRDYAVEGEQKADFIDVIAWRKTAETVCKHFAKGRGIFIVGRIQVRQYEDKYKNKRRATELVADMVKFIDNKPCTSEQEHNSQESIDNTPCFEELSSDDELPF